jgi:hypothetical protein
MMRAFAVLAALGLAPVVRAETMIPSPVSVQIVDRDGRRFPQFGVDSNDDSVRSWLEAVRGENYEIRVRNVYGERLGIVIAVDGRNIIDGRKSELAHDEPMYVLDGSETHFYTGWRADLETVNEFYFSDWRDSYAEAFGDRSARGVIAVAVYLEAPPPNYRPRAHEGRDRDEYASVEAPAAESRGSAKADASAGTGYGDRRDDRVVQVRFVARADAASRHFIKYEWRETLCRKKIVDCGEPNRFWDESALGFAPPPPRRR